MDDNDSFSSAGEPSVAKLNLAKSIEKVCNKFNVGQCDKIDPKEYLNFDCQAEEILVNVKEIVKDFQNDASSGIEPEEMIEKIALGNSQALNETKISKDFIQENKNFCPPDSQSIGKNFL